MQRQDTSHNSQGKDNDEHMHLRKALHSNSSQVKILTLAGISYMISDKLDNISALMSLIKWILSDITFRMRTSIYVCVYKK